ncbi:hypothetical protein YC2023_060595 [Brassica napus]
MTNRGSSFSRCIAKDVVCKGLDHGTFVLTLRSCKFMIFLKGDAKFKFRLLLEGVIGRGKRAFVEIDRPSIPEISRETKPKRLNTEPVQCQLRGDCLLGCVRGKRQAGVSDLQGASFLVIRKSIYDGSS